MSSSETSGSSSPSPPVSAPPAGERRPRGRRWRRGLLLLIVLAGIGGLLFWWLHRRVEVYTDNAYVVGNITPIAPYVSGQVVALFVDDNMGVQPGDPIAQIDPVPLQIQVDEALADYQQARRAAAAAAITARYTDEDRR